MKEFYEYGSGDPEEKAIEIFGGLMLGFSGCFLGYKYGEARDEEYAHTTKSLLFPTFSSKGCNTACYWSLPGCLLMADGLVKGREHTKVMPDFIKVDTICSDSMFLSKQKIRISAEKSDFEKTYYTDENGNIELKFEEFLPEPAESDSVLNIIIQYKDMVNSVNVKFR